MEIKGVDVSSYQGSPDWAKVAADGIKFAILRITQKTGIDTSFEYNYKNCAANGIPVGVYKYSYALTEAAIREEAQGVIDTLAGREIDFPVFLDLEWDSQRSLSSSTLLTMIQAFREIVVAAGYKFGIYSNVDWYNNVLPDSAKNYDLWIARYPSSDTGEIKESLRPSVGVGWQYSSKGSVAGISGAVDMDVFYKDYADSVQEEGDTVATEASLRKSVATWGDKYLGIAEGSAEHKAILAIFNNSGLCSRYTMTTSDAWCATFVSAAFISLGLTGIFPCVECSCPNMIALAKSAGIWVEDDSYTPGVGDVIMYDWQDSGSGDNTGTADHVGIVHSVSGSTLKIIEGNKNDTVAYRSMQVNGKYIRGYIAPNYASAAGTTSSSVSTPTTTVTDSSTSLSVDGEIGTKTVACLQAVLGTTQDGFIDGQQPASKIYWASVSTDACKWTGGASPMVIALQALVGVDQDGLLGVKTAKATQTYLINAGYSCGDDGADGYFGENSAKALQTWLNSK